MVSTQPHGTTDTETHVNPEYDSNEDGRVDEIDPDAVGSTEIATDAVTSTEVATGAVGSDEIADGSVTRADLATLEALDLSPTDLTGSTLDPASEGVYAHHDGTGTPDAGLYRSDPGNNQWVKVEDNATTIAY